MENKLDNLFRSQLSKHVKNPSDQAWEQIHNQLAGKKKKLWIKRISIAASILLIATAGFVGYQSMNNISVEHSGESRSSNSIAKDSELVNKIEHDEKLVLAKEKEMDEVVEADEEMRVNEKMANSTLVEEIESPAQGEYDPIAVDADKSEVEIKSDERMLAEVIQPDVKIESKELLSEEKVAEDHEIQNHEKGLPAEKTNVGISPEKIAENHVVDEMDPATVAKTYPKVRIIYKANEDSELVASGRLPLINKGIDKITEFTDEHLLTAERKTKLRNTKEDLLALNFGKILNKSNKDVEN